MTSTRNRLVGAAATLGLALPLAIAMGPTADASLPGTVKINTSADTVDASPGDGDCADAAGACSLRAAVEEANANGDIDTIIFDNTAAVLGLGDDIDVTSSLTIRGFNSSVDAAGINRAFDVAAGASLAATGFDITGGVAPGTESGGAVRNAGNTTLTRVNISDSTATGGMGASGGAVFNSGTLTVNNSRFTGNSATRAGGAIEADGGTTNLNGTHLISNSTGPMPGNGGGLHITGEGTVNVNRSLVQNNTASAEGGGLWNSAGGTMNVNFSVIMGNTASGAEADNGGGGVYNDAGDLILNGAWITGNTADGASGSGGGVLNNAGSLTTVSQTRIWNNSANRAGGGVEAVDGTTIIDDSHIYRNTTGAAPGNGGGLHLTGDGVVQVSNTSVADNVAANEGGGLWNSAAGTMTVDNARIFRNEAQGADADNGGGGIYNDAGDLSVSGGFLRANTATGASGSGGGILNNAGSLSVDGTLLTFNTSNRAGGAIEAVDGATTVSNSSMVRNSTGDAPGNGGGLHITGNGTVDVSTTLVEGNMAGNEGGGLWNSAGGTMTVSNSQIANNRAAGDDADNGGGGLYNDAGDVTVTETLFQSNRATGASGSGGGVLNNAGNVSISASELKWNRSNRAGGAIEALLGTTDVTSTSIFGNVTGAAPGNGGGIHISDAGVVTVSSSNITRNVAATEGGGVWNSATGSLTISGSNVSANYAPVGRDTFTVGGPLIIN